MALAHTILTILANTPSSGYDISKRFEERISCFWQASQQQIYRELAKLEQRSWVRHETIPQAGKPDKKIYHLTEAGRQEWLHWFATPTEPTPIREDLLVKVLAGPHVTPEQLRAVIHQRRSLHARQLQQLQAFEAEHQQIPHPGLQEQFRYLTLRRGLRYEQNWLEWCDEVLTFLDSLPASDPPH